MVLGKAAMPRCTVLNGCHVQDHTTAQRCGGVWRDGQIPVGRESLHRANSSACMGSATAGSAAPESGGGPAGRESLLSVLPVPWQVPGPRGWHAGLCHSARSRGKHSHGAHSGLLSWAELPPRCSVMSWCVSVSLSFPRCQSPLLSPTLNPC